MKYLVVLSFAFYLSGLCPGTVGAQAVTNVPAGDAIELSGRVITYFGIASPSPTDRDSLLSQLGVLANTVNRELVYLQLVRIDHPGNGNSGLVYVDTLCVNAELIRRGFARVTDEVEGTHLESSFRRYEREAREQRAGLWKYAAFADWTHLSAPTLVDPVPVAPPLVAQTTTPFLNPDGPPGSWAFEPFGGYGETQQDGSDQKTKRWIAGARFVFPLGERATLFTSAMYVEDKVDIEGVPRYQTFLLQGSVRFWIGSGRGQ